LRLSIDKIDSRYQHTYPKKSEKKIRDRLEVTIGHS